MITLPDIKLEKRTPGTTLLRVGRVQVLFLQDAPLAVFDGEELWFRDLAISSGFQRQLNDFHPDSRHVRTGDQEFAWMLAAALSRAVRPLMYPQHSTTTQHEED